MPKQVFLSGPAQKQLAGLEASTRRRVKDGLSRLAAGGRVDVKKLHGLPGKVDLYRLRVGDLRVIYAEEPGQLKVTQILRRSDAYRWL